jgi:hypothetical protein
MKVFLGWLCVLTLAALGLLSCEFEDSSSDETFTGFDLFDRKLNITIDINVSGETTRIERPLICRKEWGFGTAQWAYLLREWVGGDFSTSLSDGSNILVSFSQRSPYEAYPIRDLCDTKKKITLHWGDELFPRIGWMGVSPIGMIIESYQVPMGEGMDRTVKGGHIDMETVKIAVEPDGWALLALADSDSQPASWFNNSLSKGYELENYNNIFEGFRTSRVPKASWSRVPELAAVVASLGVDTPVNLNSYLEGSIQAGPVPYYRSPLNESTNRYDELVDLTVSDIAPLVPDDDGRTLYWLPEQKIGFDLYFWSDFTRVPEDFHAAFLYRRLRGVDSKGLAASGSPLSYDIVVDGFHYPWDLSTVGSSAFQSPVFYDPASESIIVLRRLGLLVN